MTKTQIEAAEMEAELDAQQARYRANDPELAAAKRKHWSDDETQDIGRN